MQEPEILLWGKPYRFRLPGERHAEEEQSLRDLLEARKGMAWRLRSTTSEEIRREVTEEIVASLTGCNEEYRRLFAQALWPVDLAYTLQSVRQHNITIYRGTFSRFHIARIVAIIFRHLE